jgi:hypothetical protein
VTNYACTNCSETFMDYPAANNHELATKYAHLTVRTEDMAEELVASPMNKCGYCPESKPEGQFHDCLQATEAKCRLEATLDGIHTMMERPGSRPLTSLQLKSRADHRRQIATALQLKGLPVRPEYAQNGKI